VNTEADKWFRQQTRMAYARPRMDA